MVERIEMEHPAHFIGASDCKFWRATKVGPWIVSSVGEYRPRGELTPIGSGGALYETFVFRASAEPMECGCYEPADWSELAGVRYWTQAEAEAGHAEMCDEWAARAANAA